jgi:hypothetical protein
MNKTIGGTMIAGVRRGGGIKGGMTARVHVFSAAVWQKQCSFFGLKKLFFLKAVSHVDVDKIFDNSDGIADGQSRMFVDVKFVDKVSCHVREFLIEFVFFRYLCDIFEYGLREF